MSAPTTLHIINHTHWDREWFLTSAYTSRWIPRLIDRVYALAEQNPGYRYLLDGQTLVVEDLLHVAPDYEKRIRDLLRAGHLQVGPYYCQPDWRLSSGELLIRNLLLGIGDVRSLGGQPPQAGWLVDTFGHISQAPQIHQLFDIDAAFVWRGAPLLIPYFRWQGPDGSTLFTVNLFGGYRNLYGVSHAPGVAAQRLQTEVRKLRPFYPTADIPLFDGYDLEDNPEDPVTFYDEHPGAFPETLVHDVILQEATPATFAAEMASKKTEAPVVSGELNSGKYGATFPGTLSTRTYLKVMANDCERLLFRVAEPLATMAHMRGRPYEEEPYEHWARQLLQNAVHDCICGVSIDQVHEKMEDSYRQVHHALWQDVNSSLSTVLAGFDGGLYAVSTNALPADFWQVIDDRLHRVRTDGVGAWPVAPGKPVETASEPASSFTWRNAHYEATVHADGTVHATNGQFGALVVLEELGDTYSTEPGRQLGMLQPLEPPVLVQKSDEHAVVTFRAAWRGASREVTADVTLWFDPSPLLRWMVDLDSRGTNLRVDMAFASGAPGDEAGDVHAAMPFDIVERPAVDADLLPRDLPGDLENVLLGQRELRAVRDFPFQDVVRYSAAGQDGFAILAQGIHSYCVDEVGTLRLTLRRSVEWLTKGALRDRAGDAGPFFYVPDARCERRVRHEVGVVPGNGALDEMALQAVNATFQNPPLLARVRGDGKQQTWQFLCEPLLLSSLRLQNGAPVARFANPLQQAQSLSRSYDAVDVWGELTGQIRSLAPGQIAAVRLPGQPPRATQSANHVSLLTRSTWRVGQTMSKPDATIMDELQEKIAEAELQVARLRSQHADAKGAHASRLQHGIYMLQREQLEYRLSLLLNQRKLSEGTPPGADYLYGIDEEIASVGRQLNALRIKRRIYDYVVQAL